MMCDGTSPTRYGLVNGHTMHSEIMLPVLVGRAAEKLIDQVALAGSDSTERSLHANGLKVWFPEWHRIQTHKDLNRLLFLVKHRAPPRTRSHAESTTPFRRSCWCTSSVPRSSSKLSQVKGKIRSGYRGRCRGLLSGRCGTVVKQVRPEVWPHGHGIVNGGRIVQEVTSPAVATFLMHVMVKSLVSDSG